MSNEVIKSEFSLALLKANLSIQKIQTELDSILFVEENIPQIKEKLSLLDKMDKIAIEEHKKLKEPYLKASQQLDADLRSFKSITE